jgi:hypothetical protein
VDGSDEAPNASDVEVLVAWNLRDSKARSDLLLHCSKKQLISLRSLPTSKQVWERLKQLYEKSNKASQVNLHKQLCRMTMSDSDNVMTFLESWQSLLQEAEIVGCTFTDDQQVNLLLGALLDSWSAFVTTPGGMSNLTFTTLLSNILQQNSINLSKPDVANISAFYVKGKFIKQPSNKIHLLGQKFKTSPSYSRPYFRPASTTTSNPKSNSIIYHHCGIPGHKAPECRKKKRDLRQGQSNTHTNNYTSDEPLVFFNAITALPTISSSWYLDSGASQHMTALRSLLQDYHKLDTPQTILLGDNSSYKATGFGFALLRLSNGKGLLIKDILFVPGLAKNLISVAQLTSIGNTIVIFKSDQCIITTESPTSKEPMKLYIPKFENLFSLSIGIEISSSAYSATTPSKSDLTTMKWHHRLGHLNI